MQYEYSMLLRTLRSGVQGHHRKPRCQNTQQSPQNMPGCTQEQRVSQHMPELQGFDLPLYQQVSEVTLEGTEKAS